MKKIKNDNSRYYLVNEYFISIQGEGLFAGKPSIFLRLWGCNLRCKFCDTPYTLKQRNWQLRNNYKKIHEEEFLKRLSILIKDSKIRNIVITGGEPLVQPIEFLIHYLSNDFNLTFEIETNGTFIKKTKQINNLTLKNNSSVCYNVSFKFKNSSGNKNYVTKELIKEWRALSNVVYKFVYDPKNFKEEEEIIKLLPINNVMIMPLGANLKDLLKNGKEAWEYCIQHNLRYSSRMHVVLFNTKRGV